MLFRKCFRSVVIPALSLLLAVPAAQSAEDQSGSVLVFGSAVRQMSVTGADASPDAVAMTHSAAEGAVFVSRSDWCRISSMRMGDGNEYKRLQLPGMAECGETGAPQIPCHTRLIHVPDGAEVRLVIEPFEWRDVTGTFDLAPVQPPRLATPEAPPPEFVIDRGLYAADQWTDEQPVRIAQRLRIRGRDLILVVYTPLSYNPARRTLRAAPEVFWRLEFDLPAGGSPAPRPDPVGDAAFAGLFGMALDAAAPVESMALSDPVQPLSDDGADYLIITPDDCLNQIQPLADLKAAMGLETRVVPLSAIGSQPTAHDITAYIRNAYETWSPRPTYLLLVGDVQNLPPHNEQAWPDREGMPPTDLYYTTVDGDDVFPDIFCGRLPAGSPAECAIMVDKIVNHQVAPDTDPAFRDSTLVTGKFEDLFITNGVAWGEDGIENPRFIEAAEALKDYLELNAQTVHTAYWADSSFLPRRYSDVSLFHVPESVFVGTQEYIPYAAAKTRVLERWNQGVSLVSYHAHGNWTGWGSLNVYDLPSLHNGTKLPVVLSLTCSTGEYDIPDGDCFAEELMDMAGGGAAAVLANTRVSYMRHDFWFRNGLHEALWPGYFATLATIPGYLPSAMTYTTDPAGRSPRLGPAMAFGKLVMCEKMGGGGSQDSNRYIMEVKHLFGDPHMHFQTWKDNVIRVSHPASASAAHAQFSLYAIDLAGAFIQDATVTVTSSAGDNATFTTDVIGHVPVSMHPLALDFLTVTVSKRDYMPYVGTISLVPDSLTVTHPASVSAVTGGFVVHAETDGNTPVASVVVTATSAAGDYAVRTTDVNGDAVFSFTPLSIESLAIRATKRGYATYEGTIQLVPGMLTIDHPSQADEGRPFTVSVRDGAAPLAGATVRLSFEGAVVDERVSDINGQAAFPQLPLGEGEVSVEVGARGYAAESGTFTLVSGTFVFAPFPGALERGVPHPAGVTLVSSLDGISVISGYQGTADISVDDAPVAPPSVVITDCVLRDVYGFKFVKLQNVEASGNVDMAGWMLAANGSAEDVNVVHASVKILNRGLVALIETATYSALFAIDDPRYWGAVESWDSEDPGWVMLLDDQTNVVDFVAWGWTAEELAGFAPTVAGRVIPMDSHWFGDGVPIDPAIRAISRLRVTAPQDRDVAADFEGLYSTSTPPRFAEPFQPYGYPLPMSPETIGPFVNGVWTGPLTVLDLGSNAQFRVADDLRSGLSDPFDIEPSPQVGYGFNSFGVIRNWNTPFPVTIEALDEYTNRFDRFTGSVSLYAFDDIAASPVLITECGINASPCNYIEIQNVSESATVTDGWKLLAGDDAENIDLYNAVVKDLPATLSAGQIRAWTDDERTVPAQRWGEDLRWDVESPGWVMLLDASNQIRDFVVWQWDRDAITNMVPVYGGSELPVESEWVAHGYVLPRPSSRGGVLSGSLQRHGSVDHNAARDFRWWPVTSRGATNSGLELPILQSRQPARISPLRSDPFTGGVWSGTVTVHEERQDIYLEAFDDAGLFGTSHRFDIWYGGALTLSVPPAVREGDGAVEATVTRKETTGPLTVQLTSSHPSRLSVPASVVIPNGARTVAFDLSVTDNALLDFAQQVSVTAAASGFRSDVARLTVEDNDAAGLLVQAPASCVEGAGLLPSAGLVVLPGPADVDAVIRLTSSYAGRLTVPASVAIPAGEDRAAFDITVPDNDLADGNPLVSILATPDDVIYGTGVVHVLDDDPYAFRFTGIPASATVAVPFSVTVEAISQKSALMTTYNRAADLSCATAGGALAMTPGATQPFTAGVWSGEICITQTGSGAVLTARDGTAEGDSAPFLVTHGALAGFEWTLHSVAGAHAGAWLPAQVTAVDANGYTVESFAGPARIRAERHDPARPVRVLMFSRYADTTANLPQLRQAITRYFPLFEESLTGTVNPVTLAGLLAEKDVFLLLPQPYADPGAMDAIGSDFAAVLTDFVMNGGVVIGCSGLHDEHRLLRQAGLATLMIESLGGGMTSIPFLRISLPHALTTGVPDGFFSWEAIGFSAPDCQKVVHSQTNGVPAVMHRALGAGHVVMLGTDFTEDVPGFDRILANAVRMGLRRSPIPAPGAPLSAETFVSGVWSGVVQVASEATDACLIADDQQGSEGASGFFDLGPLRINGFSLTPSGEWVLEWNSAGVTPYTVYRYKTLSGTGQVERQGVLATPPGNTCTGTVESAGEAYYRIGVPAP